MTSHATTHPRRTALPWSAVFRAAGLFLCGFIAWLWFFPAGDSSWRGVSLGAVLAVAALAGGTWYLARARADSRWRAALDRYAEQEEAQSTHSRRDCHAHCQTLDRWTRRGRQPHDQPPESNSLRGGAS
jgi:hypothetical protein